MKTIAVKCQNCGASLEITPNTKVVTCQYCNSDFIIDDEVERVQIVNAEQAGFEFEQGRQRAKREEENKSSWGRTNPPVRIEKSSKDSGSGWVSIVFVLMIAWLSLCTYCGFAG